MCQGAGIDAGQPDGGDELDGGEEPDEADEPTGGDAPVSVPADCSYERGSSLHVHSKSKTWAWLRS